jgi:DNA-binding response OmpR family regulator
MSSPRYRILCVEDDPDTCELLKVILTWYEFKAVHTAREGLELARSQLFDLYLLDNWLPDSSGIELCSRIRDLDQNTPIVFLSAAAYNSDHRQAMSAGATAYLDKPVDPWLLQDTVTRLMQQVEARSLDARITEIAAHS